MNTTKTTEFSGCVIWFVLISVIGSCIMPVAFAVGGITSAYELQCEYSNGEAVVFAMPGGMLVTRVLNKMRVSIT